MTVIGNDVVVFAAFLDELSDIRPRHWFLLFCGLPVLAVHVLGINHDCLTRFAVPLSLVNQMTFTIFGGHHNSRMLERRAAYGSLKPLGFHHFFVMQNAKALLGFDVMSRFRVRRSAPGTRTRTRTRAPPTKTEVDQAQDHEQETENL